MQPADDVDYFRDPASGVDAEKELDWLAQDQLADLVFPLQRLWIYPLQTAAVRETRDPVRAMTFDGILWVLYWVDIRAASKPTGHLICVRVLRVAVLDEPSTALPESEWDLALERFAIDAESGSAGT